MSNADLLQRMVAIIERMFVSGHEGQLWMAEAPRRELLALAKEGIGIVDRISLKGHLHTAWNSTPGSYFATGRRLSKIQEDELEALIRDFDQWQFALRFAN